MNPQFRLTEPAIRDIEQIADYIAREVGLTKADRFLYEILPRLCSLPMDRYLILYIPIERDVDILRVVSGYRDLPALFAD